MLSEAKHLTFVMNTSLNHAASNPTSAVQVYSNIFTARERSLVVSATRDDRHLKIT